MTKGKRHTYQKSEQGDPFLLSDIRAQKTWILIKEENKDVCPAPIRMTYHSDKYHRAKKKSNAPIHRILKHEIIQVITQSTQAFYPDSAKHHQ